MLRSGSKNDSATAVQQPRQRDGPSGHAACLRKRRARPPRALRSALARQPNGSEVLKATTPRSIAHQAGFVRVPASVTVVPHRDPSAASTACAGPRLSPCPSSACRVSRASVPRSSAIASLRATREAEPPRAVFRNAVPSQRRRIRSVGFHELAVHFPQSATVARSRQVAVAATEGNVNAKLSNKPINPTPFAASRRLLAQAARRDSCAGYRHRWPDNQTALKF